MQIKKAEVENFRKLKNVTIDLDDSVTLIVGRNNSGKTSLSEVFNKFLGPNNPGFTFDDFSFSVLSDYSDALNLYEEYLELHALGEEKEDESKIKLQEAKTKIPSIILNIYIEYGEQDDDSLGGFSELNLNLDDSRRDISVSCRYCIIEGEKFLSTLHDQHIQNKDLQITHIVENIYSDFYAKAYFAFDKENQDIIPRSINPRQIENAFILSLICAQRDLDDQSYDKKGRIAKCMSSFLDISKVNEENIKNLEERLSDLAKKMEQDDHPLIYGPIIEDLKKFGIKEKDSKIITKALFDAKTILKNSSRFLYDMAGRNVPESYNGLGYSNLIYITLQISIFCQLFEERTPRSLSHILFIEEPEAHLHPQMQMVFIRKIKEFIRQKEWNVQVVITTHSSQILSDCEFKCIRYFEIKENYCVDVKNIEVFIANQNAQADENAKKLPCIRFLEKYMNLGTCNLFFADKIIMVEGITEKIILPQLIKKDPILSSEYISLLEVGGACAHLFKELISFINVKTLIITDIDSCSPDGHHSACPVMNDNAITSNAVLKKWIPQRNNITDLLTCSENDKSQGLFRVAYQIPDKEGLCGRSFEEAFFLANAENLEKYSEGLVLHELFENLTKDEIIDQAYNITRSDNFNGKKSGIAMDILLMEKYVIPRYIEEGLEWLAEN